MVLKGGGEFKALGWFVEGLQYNENYIGTAKIFFNPSLKRRLF